MANASLSHAFPVGIHRSTCYHAVLRQWFSNFLSSSSRTHPHHILVGKNRFMIMIRISASAMPFFIYLSLQKSHLLNLVWSQIPPPTFPVDLHPTCRCSHPSDPPHSLTATALQVRVYCRGPCRCWTDLSSTVSTATGDNIIVICCRLEGCCNQNTQQVESWLTWMLPIRDYCHKLLPKMVELKNYSNKQLHRILSPINLCYVL